MSGRVLLLDDDESILDAMTDIIAAFCEKGSIRASSFAEMERLKTEILLCDTAFLDINLGPDKPSGLDAYRWLRLEDFAGRIFFFTGHASSHPLVAQALQLGDVKVLSKPTDVDRIIDLVNGGT